MLISIIMPAFNAEQYIEESIKSVLNQSWSEWELIIIDDGSSDHTKLIISKYAANDSRIRLLSNPGNQGVANSRNRGVREARGEWIAFLDSDDLWTSDKLSLQTAQIKEWNARFVFTGSSFVDENGHISSYVLEIPEQIEYKELLKQNLISCSSVLIAKDLLIDYPMKDGNVHEDFVVWLSILRDKGMRAYGINKPMLIYRIHSNSKSARKWKAMVMNWNVYQQIGLNFGACCYYQFYYAMRGIRKYKKLMKK